MKLVQLIAVNHF